MAQPRNDLLDRITYAALRVVSMAVHSWGIDASLFLARMVGRIMYIVDKRHRDRAMGNLGFCFPNMSLATRRVVARRSMEALCMLAVDVFFTTRLIRVDTFNKYIEMDGRFHEVLKLMLHRNRGLIILTGHYGNWEVLGYMMATIGFPTVSVARPLDNPYISEFVFGVRERTGQRIITKKGATEEVVSILDNNGVVGFTADQNAGKKGIFVDFFGRKASSYKSIGLLAMQQDIPVVVGYARRIGDGFRFSLRLPGHHLSRGLEIAGRPAALHHTAVHKSDRRFRQRRSGTVFVGASPVENPAERGSGGEVRLGSANSKQTLMHRDHRFPGVPLSNSAQAADDERIAQGLVIDQACDRERKIMRTFCGDEQTVFSIADDVADARHIGSDDRHARGHRFNQHEAEAFGFAGEDEHADVGQRILRARDLTAEGEAIGFFAKRFEVRSLGAVAEDFEVGAIGQRHHRFDQVIDPLDRIEPADETNGEPPRRRWR